MKEKVFKEQRWSNKWAEELNYKNPGGCTECGFRADCRGSKWNYCPFDGEELEEFP